MLVVADCTQAVVFKLLASGGFKDNRDNRDNSWRKKMCFFKIVDMVLLNKNIVLERDVVFERDAVFEQNKKLSQLSLLSLTPRKQALFFNCLQAVFLKTIETILGAKIVLL